MGETGARVCRWLLCASVLAALPGCAMFEGKGGLFGTQRTERSLRAGDLAPAFTLKRLDDDSKRVRLASHRNNKPVVLFFGSYT